MWTGIYWNCVIVPVWGETTNLEAADEQLLGTAMNVFAQTFLESVAAVFLLVSPSLLKDRRKEADTLQHLFWNLKRKDGQERYGWEARAVKWCNATGALRSRIVPERSGVGGITRMEFVKRRAIGLKRTAIMYAILDVNKNRCRKSEVQMRSFKARWFRTYLVQFSNEVKSSDARRHAAWKILALFNVLHHTDDAWYWKENGFPAD